jgi:hypothetical protein
MFLRILLGQKVLKLDFEHPNLAYPEILDESHVWDSGLILKNCFIVQDCFCSGLYG